MRTFSINSRLVAFLITQVIKLSWKNEKIRNTEYNMYINYIKKLCVHVWTLVY